MNDFVKMESKQCPVCGIVHEHGTGILISKQLRDIKPNFENKVVTGHSLCEEHSKLADDGYVALVVGTPHNDKATRVKSEDISLTGQYMHIKRNAMEKMFNISLSDATPMVYIDTGLFNSLVEMEKTKAEE